MHEGIEYAIFLYLTSDSAGIDMKLVLSSPKPFPEVKEEPVVPPDLPRVATDWRYMTADEVKAYKAGER